VGGHEQIPLRIAHRKIPSVLSKLVTPGNILDIERSFMLYSWPSFVNG
jgi:hypothetical protein